jgi:putative integral membrane protein (TIGR02587 family)
MPTGRKSTQEEPTTPADVMRGVAGGVILGLPLIYTQEVWLLGASIHPFGILALLLLTFGLNVALSHYVGFETGRIDRPWEDAIVGLGLSILLSGFLLAILDRISFDIAPENVLGIIAFCALPTSLGFALGNALAPIGGGIGAEELKGGGGDLLAGAAGAAILSLNIAPTEEPLLLAYEIGWIRIAGLVLVSLILSYLMVFYAEFEGREQRRAHRGPSQGPLVETLLAYLVAVAVAAALLKSFGQLEMVEGSVLAEVLVLSFPASMGAALGRLLV